MGWAPAVYRGHVKSVSVGLRCPIDQVNVALDLLEWAGGEESDAELTGIIGDGRADLELRALHAAYPDRVFVGDRLVTVGLGKHSESWSVRQHFPAPNELSPGRVPVVMVTGTNGKTSTTRLVAHLGKAAGLCVGRTSSDAVVIGDETVSLGDWTGPGAARQVLRDPRVDLAVLETARGGILRRGLVIGGIDVAIVTNVTPEHFGEWGIDSIDDMAWAKLVLADALRPGGTLIIPAVSPPIYRRIPGILERRPDVRVWTFSSTRRAAGWADDRYLRFTYASQRPRPRDPADAGESCVPLSEVPITFGGTARHNVENALAATLAGLAIGLPGHALSQGLRTFQPSTENNPGRMNTFRLPNGALAVVDFAHTSDGVRRIVETIRRWPKSRRTLLLGQAGDRTDEDLVGMATEAASLDAELIVLKEVAGRLYDRAPGEVPNILRRALLQAGVTAERIVGPTPDEETGVVLATRDLSPQHVAVLLIHETLVGAQQVLGSRGAVEI